MLSDLFNAYLDRNRLYIINSEHLCLTYASVVQCSLDCKLSIDFVVPFCLTLFHITHLWKLILFFCLTHTQVKLLLIICSPHQRGFFHVYNLQVFMFPQLLNIYHVMVLAARYLKYVTNSYLCQYYEYSFSKIFVFEIKITITI